ncbi:MAG: hypothetical protein RJA57_946 [Bacteroidota bacterium]|jgi:hypothetical protein
MPSVRDRLHQLVREDRSAVLDWITFMLSLSLGFLFPSLRALVRSPQFPSLLLIAVGSYALGATLKQAPLRYRLHLMGRGPAHVPYAFILGLGHWILLFISLFLAAPAIARLLSLPAAQIHSGSRGIFIILYLIGASLVTWLVFRSKRPPVRSRRPGPLSAQELLADILLVAGVGFLTFLFWERVIMAVLGAYSIERPAHIWYLFLFLGFGFLLFYLPLRYLFIIDTERSGHILRRFSLFYVLLLVRALLNMVLP